MIQELIKLYRQCEAQAWGDNPVTFDYFIDWLESMPAPTDAPGQGEA